MERFIAIKVGKGDAFYLENMGKRILVDGGASAIKFPSLFKQSTKQNDVDIVICTHSDIDHVNGLIGYFESGMVSKEVWLPGSWLSRLDDMLKTPNEFLEELVRNINDLDDSIVARTPSLEELGDIVSKSSSDDNVQIFDDEDNYYPATLSYRYDEENIIIEKLDDDTSVGFSKKNPFKINNNISFNDSNSTLYSKRKKNIEAKAKIFESSINAAKKILELATLAYNSGAIIRWFKYSNFTSGGGMNYLHPVNSNEIFQARKRIALEYLCLTKANVESLVFYSYNLNNSAGVLFSADSNFSFTKNFSFLAEDLIITTPHHGAEANSIVYSILEPHIKSKAIFVRSDTSQFSRKPNSKAKTNPRPCSAFKNLIFRKFCTICFDSSAAKQDIVLQYTYGKGWDSHSYTCTCK